jgi:hypothetical protein
MDPFADVLCLTEYETFAVLTKHENSLHVILHCQSWVSLHIALQFLLHGMPVFFLSSPAPNQSSEIL